MSLSEPRTSVHSSKAKFGGHYEAVVFIGPTDDLKEQLGTGLRERNVAQFVDDQQVTSLTGVPTCKHIEEPNYCKHLCLGVFWY